MISRTVFLFIMLPISCFNQESNVPQKYLDRALNSNLSLQQRNFSYQKSLAALAEARGMFMPSISINARYTRAGGGRKIDIPVGEFVNPIHRTLNFLLQQNVFPENVSVEPIPFLREKEQETKIRVSQPLFKPEILYNYRIKNRMQQIELSSRNAYKRELIAAVKTAYFSYLKSLAVIDVLDQTRTLLEENLRVSRKLVETDKATAEVIYRAEADLSTLEKEEAEARKNREMSMAYLNFLLNREPGDTIDTVSVERNPVVHYPDLETAQQEAVQGREELKQLDAGISAARDGIKLKKSAFLPGIIGVLDYGFQGEEYRFTGKDDFWMASAILEWNLFNGFQDRAQVQQAKIEEKQRASQREELEARIVLQTRESYHSLVVAARNFESARNRIRSEKKSFEIVNRKYREGMALHVEYLDARNSYVQSMVDLSLALYDYYIRQAEFEKVTAAYPLD